MADLKGVEPLTFRIPGCSPTELQTLAFPLNGGTRNRSAARASRDSANPDRCP